MFATTTLKTLIPEGWRQNLRDIQVGLSISHVSGPKSVAVATNQAVVSCVVKNGEFYLDQFVDHYLSLGFKHVYLLDNGSTDGTVERAGRHKHVSVYRCTMPVGGHQGLLKKQLADRAVSAGWCLDVDIDEFFDYPYSDTFPLNRFIEYLNRKHYDAVLTQMLDMFSDQPLSYLAANQRENFRQIHRYYDISQVTKTGYLGDALTVAHGPGNHVGSAGTSLHWGGIRKTVFGFKCLLTKHSLFRTGADLQLFPHVHYVNRARLADVSGLLLHYKFASNAREEAAQNKAAFPALSQGYDRILETIDSRPEFRIKGEKAVALGRASDLLDNGFLFASDDYRSSVRAALGEGLVTQLS